MDCSEGQRASKVRFAEAPPLSPPPMAPSSQASEIRVSMGILSCGGIYSAPILELSEGAAAPVIKDLQASNLSTELQRQPSRPASLLLRFWADRPGPFHTTFTVCLCGEQEVTVHVTATIMPRNKGTPGLKPSVHCLGFTLETDTEGASDWQGFD